MLWALKKCYYRVYQFVLKLATYVLDWTEPAVYRGPGSVKKLPVILKNRKIGNVLVVTDKTIVQLGLMGTLLAGLDEKGIRYHIFDAVEANPSVETIEEARRLYLEHGCGAFLAFGGGSPIDCAKVAAARISNPRKPVKKMRGILHVTHRPPTVIAVPTTAGTGSETTVAAVVKDTATHEKFAVMDPKLRPRYAILDPELTVGLPPHITAATGIDALTHAVESFVGNWATPYTDGMALTAVGLIFENLRTACRHGGDLQAREKMLLASTYAGIAFTRANVGYVHAIAHQFGGLYHTPHGLANAIMLPYVLRYSSPSITSKLAELAVRARVGRAEEPEDELAEKFLQAVEQLNRDLGIPTWLDALKESDIPALAANSLSAMGGIF
ncbi:MAG TPA: iron-containing alcohol dehydrogenase, partial [Clostridiales bacterium]|nr:iron-containing alcohol dehydrogenase [Clostridiales bacterium]